MILGEKKWIATALKWTCAFLRLDITCWFVGSVRIAFTDVLREHVLGPHSRSTVSCSQ
jgi:hypothetical protein